MKVAIAGVTGAVGQRFLQLLQNHPWFEVNEIIASERSKGKSLKEACKFRLFDFPEKFANMKIKGLNDRIESRLVFSALPSDAAAEYETKLVNEGKVVASNAGAHRMDEDVPLVIPEVNPEHLELVKGKKGFIITNANCTTTQLVLALKPLHDEFGLEKVSVVSMQALSGAGYPGVSSMDIAGNVLPHINGEEEKVETEPLKLLGKIEKNKVTNAEIKVSASCNRVNVTDGHLECISVKLLKKATKGEVIEAFRNYSSLPQELELPSAPKKPIHYIEDEERPQPRLDKNTEKGMSVVVGRLKEDKILDFRFHLLGHNTIRGAAGGSILNAELLFAKKILEG
ncbi:MAG: aspartate-semialdehyde dehydrogenase [Candidatus Nanoarchaeia archaeon]